MSKEDGRLTGGRFQFASDPVAFEVKYATTTYTKEVVLTFRAGPVCGRFAAEGGVPRTHAALS